MVQLLILLLILTALAVLLSFIVFLVVFYVPARKEQDPDKIDLPPGKIYEPFYDQMRKWVITARNTPHDDVSITSYDGLKLYGRFYSFSPDAPIELMFHGYRGNAERDLAGGIHRAFRLGHSVLIVDQRCSGRSEGNVITFGVKEHRDCLAWIDFMLSHYGKDIRIILTGISMGASTVLMASDKQLPANVIGILADCGFHSAREVICCVAKSMHLPAGLLYPFVKLGAKLFGGFDLEELTPVDSVRNCKIPVLFFHGEADDYVPSYMSRINYEACGSKKKLVLIPGAGHGLSFPVEPERYCTEMMDFFHNSDS